MQKQQNFGGVFAQAHPNDLVSVLLKYNEVVLLSTKFYPEDHHCDICTYLCVCILSDYISCVF